MNLNTLKAYLAIHLVSLTQDLDELHSKDEDFIYIEAQIELTKHILELINER